MNTGRKPGIRTLYGYVCSVVVIGAEIEIGDQVQIPPEVIAFAIAHIPLQR